VREIKINKFPVRPSTNPRSFHPDDLYDTVAFDIDVAFDMDIIINF